SSVLKADSESQEHPARDRSRSYASQLFQATAISIEYGSYRMHASPTNPADQREVVDGSEITGKHPGVRGVREVTQFPGLAANEIEQINSEIAGESNPLSIIKHADVAPEGSGLNVSNEQELADKLKAVKDSGQLPALIFVNARHEPFFSDSLGGL